MAGSTLRKTVNYLIILYALMIPLSLFLLRDSITASLKATALHFTVTLFCRQVKSGSDNTPLSAAHAELGKRMVPCVLMRRAGSWHRPIRR